MSIEQDLNRIATALETIAKLGGLNTVAIPAPSTSPVKETKVKKEAVKPIEAEPDIDPFTQNEAAPVVDFDSLTELLKAHAKKLGTKLTVALIIKHGADRTTPKMNTIPEANFKACFDEATADLKKVEGKIK